LELQAIGASERSAGKKYKDAVRWKQSTAMSEKLSNLVLRDCKADQFSDCDLVFSGLNSDVAGDLGRLNPFELPSELSLTKNLAYSL
jgi:aspartate-semialdehyde dehydrogenase